MKDASCRVEREVLVGGYPWRKPAIGGSPFYRKHVVYIRLDEFHGAEATEEYVPVNARPKTSSSGGVRTFGVRECV